MAPDDMLAVVGRGDQLPGDHLGWWGADGLEVVAVLGAELFDPLAVDAGEGDLGPPPGGGVAAGVLGPPGIGAGFGQIFGDVGGGGLRVGDSSRVDETEPGRPGEGLETRLGRGAVARGAGAAADGEAVGAAAGVGAFGNKRPDGEDVEVDAATFGEFDNLGVFHDEPAPAEFLHEVAKVAIGGGDSVRGRFVAGLPRVGERQESQRGVGREPGPDVFQNFRPAAGAARLTGEAFAVGGDRGA